MHFVQFALNSRVIVLILSILPSHGYLCLPADWLVIIGVIVAIAAILIVCAVVAKRKRYGCIDSFIHLFLLVNLNTDRFAMKTLNLLPLSTPYYAIMNQY